jgi:hypothetical protein
MNRPNKWVRRQLDALREKAMCVGEGPHLGRIQFAHVEETPLSPISRGRGRKKRYYDIVKNPDKYVPLCEACHLDFDKSEKS